jgi:hypothetical protein
MLNYRATPTDDALLSLVSSRISRSRSDTLRLLVRAAAAELDTGATRGPARAEEVRDER